MGNEKCGFKTCEDKAFKFTIKEEHDTKIGVKIGLCEKHLKVALDNNLYKLPEKIKQDILQELERRKSLSS